MPAALSALPLAIVRGHGRSPAGGPLLLEPGFPYGEDLLQFLWESRLFDARQLRTTDGRAVQVLKPGRILRQSGPDLSDALLRIDGQIWAGNVEVHLRSSEWNAHGHQFDPAYDNVVLHVVYAYDSDVYMTKGAKLPTVELRSRVDGDRIQRHRDLMHSRSWVPCAPQVHRVQPSRVAMWLERVLVERLERKAADVETLHKALGRDARATFHHLLLRGMGAKVNAEPFAMLARVLPWRILMKYRDDPLRTEALLFGQAGLLQVDLEEDHPRRLQEEHAALARLHGLHPMPMAAWKFGGMRPANLPTVRIAQLARLITRLDDAFGGLLEHEDVRPLRAALDVDAGPYWRTHYVFGRSSRPASKRLGQAAVDGLITNTIVPYLFAMGRLHGRQASIDQALRLLEQLPPEHNAITDGWAALGVVNDSAARSQALIELKNTYCALRKCLFCTVGAELLKR